MGDFEAAAALYWSIPAPGIQMQAQPATGDGDVEYVGVIYGITEPFHPPQFAVMPAQIITLVWRPAFRTWLVHSFGGYTLPEDVPHG